MSYSTERRSFLVKAGAAAMLFGLSSRLARANVLDPFNQKRFESFLPQLKKEKPKGFFVTLSAGLSGGLDATLGLDPVLRTPHHDQKDLFLEYRDEDISTHPSGIRLGPSARPLLKHAADFSVVNGIVMRRDSGHGTLMDYIQSGDQTALLGSMSVEHNHEFEITPFGMIHNLTTVAAGNKDILSSSVDVLISKLMSGEVSEINPNIETTLLKEAWDALMLMIQRVPSVKKRFNELPTSEIENDAQIRLLVASFLTGASREASFALTPGALFDTHADHLNVHKNSQERFWTEVSKIFDYFKNIEYQGSSLFDHTTFFVVTEFSRTPFLNMSNGKDHNPFTNSCLIAGRGVRGGQTIGGSHVISRFKRADEQSLHIGLPYDYKRGEVTRERRPESALIFPENVTATLREILGLPKTSVATLSRLIRS